MNTLLSDSELVAHAQFGDMDAFNQLVLKYQDGMYHYALSLIQDPDLADDVTQDSFIKAFQHIASFKGGSFRSWLFKIVTNTVRDAARRKVRYPFVPLYPLSEDGDELESTEWLVDPNQSVEDTVQRHEDESYFGYVLNELPEGYRCIITLIDLQGMDYAEVAAILNIPLGTVKSRIARARVQVKNKLIGTQITPISWGMRVQTPA